MKSLPATRIALHTSGAMALLLAAALPNVVYAEDQTGTQNQNANALAAAVNVTENSPNKDSYLSGNSHAFTYDDNHYLLSNQDLRAFAYANISQACAVANCSGMDQGAGDVTFGSESMKQFAGIQDVGINTASGGIAQAQAATVVHGTVQLTNP